MDKEQIRKALDHFENDEFTDAKEILQKEISQKRNEYVNGKLDLDEAWMTEQDDKEEDEDKKKKKKNGEEEEEEMEEECGPDHDKDKDKKKKKNMMGY